MKHNTRWLALRTVQKNLFRVFQQLSVLPSEELVLQASSAKGVACEISEQSEAQNQCNGAERIVIHACKTLSSGLREALFWPKNCLRSKLTASKFQNFLGVGRQRDARQSSWYFHHCGRSAFVVDTLTKMVSEAISQLLNSKKIFFLGGGGVCTPSCCVLMHAPLP